jgi:hypothetical protein
MNHAVGQNALIEISFLVFLRESVTQFLAYCRAAANMGSQEITP